MNLLDRFLPQQEFDSYEDFKKNYRLNIPEGFNFAYDVVDEYARLQPDKPALVWCNDAGEERRLCFGDISRLSSQVANAYRALGIKKGDAVLLMLKQRVEAWLCIIGLEKLGAICIPASFQLTEKDIIYRCNAARVKMITAVDDEDILHHISLALPGCTTLRHVGIVGSHIPQGEPWLDFRGAYAAASDSHPRPCGTPEDTTNRDPMLIYFSSGTTGMPKMILHDFDYPLGHIVTAKYWQQVEDEGLHLTVSDSGWAKFGWGKIFGQWICGAVNVAYDTDKFNAAQLLKTMNRLQLTTFCAPPTIYRFLIKEDLSICDFGSIHHCGIAGEPLNPEVYYRFMEATGLEVREGFGQSETSVLIANFPWFKVKPGSTGKPSPLYDLDIVDENGNPCEDGVVGSIVVKNTDKQHPTGLFRCYYKDEEAMDRSWKNGVYNTGDMAWRDSEGYFWFEGRNDDVIKCSGYRIGPFEVESALLTHPCVLECAVTAVPDPVRGQVVKATVVLAKNRGYTPSEQLKKELQNHVKKVTAPYKYPRVVEFVDELPKTVSGKIRRVEIRENDKAGR
ncbi:MAG: AMP-binding protein [Provencibacterium sp.]|jgi:acetyl-CoA synthetase|nr:AMP-binding protein [Provencibacterium sp.]